MKFTILGASGFIGSRLATQLAAMGHVCYAPHKGDPVVFSQALGHVIYCIGLTADFRSRPFDTVRAHVCYLTEILEKSQFDSLLYLSSTRVYEGALSGIEDATVPVRSADPSDLYNLSKLLGEAVCLSSDRETIRVARLSNVYGDDFESENFLCSIVKDAVNKKILMMQTTHDSAKDYINVKDVVAVLPRIALAGRRRLYNVASGVNVSNRELLDRICALTQCHVEVADQARTLTFPPIATERLQSEFSFTPANVLTDLKSLLKIYRCTTGETTEVRRTR